MISRVPTVCIRGRTQNSIKRNIRDLWSYPHHHGSPPAIGDSVSPLGSDRDPFHEAVFLGGSDNVRGFRRERFAGDASLYGNVELRLKFGRALIIIPGEYGIFGLADIGRVYLKGESSTRWHRAAGGGLFFSVLDLSTVFSLAVAQSEERISVYFRLGYSF